MTELFKVTATKKWDSIQFDQAFDDIMMVKHKYGLSEADLAQLLDVVRMRLLYSRYINKLNTVRPPEMVYFKEGN